MKKILLSLFVGLIGLINFGYCDNITLTDGLEEDYHNTNTFMNPLYNTSSNDIYKFCIYNNGSSYIDVWYGTYKVDLRNGYNYPICFAMDKTIESVSVITNDQYGVYSVSYISSSEFNSLNCQSEFNLIPLSSVDQNYCLNNNLCPSSDCPDNPGDYTGDLQYSNIYINNILHPGKQNIFINIPDYITWDYSQNEVDFNVYVGSGYDVDYINSIVDINSYRPTSTDFTNVFVSGLTLIFPYIFVALLILFIWKLLKRIFK